MSGPQLFGLFGEEFMFSILRRWLRTSGLLWQGPLMSFAHARLGEQRMVIANQATGVWRKNAPSPAKVAIRYTEATIENCVAENIGGKAQWVLVWTLGLSLRAQLNTIEAHRYALQCFDVSRESARHWWTSESEMHWAQRGAEEGGYRLLDFSGRFGDMPWREQEARIVGLGSVVRAAEATVAEAAISFVITRESALDFDMFPMSHWFHWGPSRDSQGRRVRIGEFNGRGMVIGAESEDNYDPRLRVVLERKLDF
jgi:hypothetical protein